MIRPRTLYSVLGTSVEVLVVGLEEEATCDPEDGVDEMQAESKFMNNYVAIN